MRWTLLICLLALLLPLPQPRRASAAELPGERVRLDEVLRVVADEYVARDRIQPPALLEGALRAAGEAIPALMVERGDGPHGPVLRLRMGARAAALPLEELTSLAALQRALEAARAFVAAGLGPEDGPVALNARFADGLLGALDSHSALLSAAAYGDFQSKASGRIGGLGMLLTHNERHLTVESVLPDSPAARAGVQPGDSLLQIGPQPALHLPVEEALGRIRGRVGTLVTLLILRPGRSAPLELTLRRSDLHFASVESRVLQEGGRERIGYLRVRSFQETTTTEVQEHLQRMRAGSAGLLGIVLDLRDNPGGVLEQAIRVADLFLERGTIVTMRGPRIPPEAVSARWYRGVTSAPLVVLMNGGTASAAEVVAGALRMNHRALLLGAPTFGKNTIQSVFPLSGGNALKLTVARFYPVGERSIEGSGIMPHIRLLPVTAVRGATRTRGLLETAVGMAPTDALEAPRPLRELPYLRGDDGTDYPLLLALRLLRLNGPQGQPVLFSTALHWATQERRRQDQRIVERLAAAHVDWSPGHGGPGGQAELDRVTLAVRPGVAARWRPLPAGEGVRGGTQVRLTLTLRNAGALPLHRVLAVAESAAPYLDGLELPVGLLPAGGSAQVAAELTLPADLPEGLEALRLRLYDGSRQLHYLATVFIPQEPPPQAGLRVAIAGHDDGTGGSRGNGDGRPQRGEVLAFSVRLMNAGDAPTGTGRYWLGGSAGETRLIRFWQPFGSVAPGHSAEDSLLLAFGAPPGAPPAALTLNLMSDRLVAPELSWAFQLRAGQPLPARVLQAPRLELVPPLPAAAGSRVVLRGTAQDDNALREVLVYRNGRKVHYAAPSASRATRLPLEVGLDMDEGRNLVRVVARDRDGLLSTRSYVLWRGRTHGFPISSAKPGGA